jgi:hypothetical protein
MSQLVPLRRYGKVDWVFGLALDGRS